MRWRYLKGSIFKVLAICLACLLPGSFEGLSAEQKRKECKFFGKAHCRQLKTAVTRNRLNQTAFGVPESGANGLLAD